MDSRILIAGLTRPQDAALAVELGAADLACDLSPESPRCVTPERAREIFNLADRQSGKIVHFSAATLESILEGAKLAGTKKVMLSATPAPVATACEEAGLTVIRVHELPTGTNLLAPILPEPSKKHPAVLTVAKSSQELTFPWEILGQDAPAYTYIGGYVRPENICALLTHNPFGVLVNSGVEREPGIKDPDRLELLFDSLPTTAG